MLTNNQQRASLQYKACVWVGDSPKIFADARPLVHVQQLMRHCCAVIPCHLQTSTAILDQLENDYVKSAKTILPDGTTHSCNVYTESSQSDAVDPQITFHQVSGLWYILAISAAVAVIALAVQFAIRYRQKIRGVVSSVTGGKIANPALEQGSKNVAVTGVEEADAVAEVIQPDEKLSTGAKPRRSAALADDERTTVQVLASPKIPGEVVSRQTTFKR